MSDIDIDTTRTKCIHLHALIIFNIFIYLYLSIYISFICLYIFIYVYALFTEIVTGINDDDLEAGISPKHHKYTDAIFLSLSKSIYGNCQFTRIDDSSGHKKKVESKETINNREET